MRKYPVIAPQVWFYIPVFWALAYQNQFERVAHLTLEEHLWEVLIALAASGADPEGTNKKTKSYLPAPRIEAKMHLKTNKKAA